MQVIPETGIGIMLLVVVGLIWMSGHEVAESVLQWCGGIFKGFSQDTT